MKYISQTALLLMFLVLVGCATPESDFRIYRQSDGTIGVHAPKGSNEAETHEVAEAECKKQGRYSAVLIDSRKTVNDRFPTTYNYLCR